MAMALPRNNPRKKRADALSVGMYGAAVLALAAGLMFTFNFNPKFDPRQMAAVVSSTLVNLANQDRTSNQVQPLTVSPALTAAAQAKANDMVANGYFAHTSPSGKTSWYWFQQAGYAFTYAGENLAVNFNNSSDVENAWMNSPEHRANILNAHFTQIGVATAQGTYNGHPATYVVQMFGSPAKSNTIAITKSNVPSEATSMAVAVAKSITLPTTSKTATTSSQAGGVSSPGASSANAGAAILGASAQQVTILDYSSGTDTGSLVGRILLIGAVVGFVLLGVLIGVWKVRRG